MCVLFRLIVEKAFDFEPNKFRVTRGEYLVSISQFWSCRRCFIVVLKKLNQEGAMIKLN